MSKESFFKDVWEVAKLIPEGRVSTYGAIAGYLSLKSAARMVGWAMMASHDLNEVPAHRVVNRAGVLSGKLHFETPTKMEELLKKEGVHVKNDRIVDFKNVFWDPSENLL